MTFKQTTYEDSTSATSSPGSADGAMHCGSPDGQTTGLFGQAVVPAPRSAAPGRRSGARTAGASPCLIRARLASLLASTAPTNGTPTNGISGQKCSVSSRSANLQRSLESRLQVQMAGYGSLEYELRWKQWDMPLGEPICAQRASARRTSASDCSGWPTPNTSERGPESKASKAKRGAEGIDLQTAARTASGWATPTAAWFGCVNVDRMLERKAKIIRKGINGNGFGMTLNQQVMLCGWSTPTSTDAERRGAVAFRPGYGNLNEQVGTMVSPWATPSSRDWKDTPNMAATGINPNGTTRVRLDQLPRQAGTTSTLCAALSQLKNPDGSWKSGVGLNPEHSRWLMGYPAEWGCCGVTAMQSSPKSRRHSFVQVAKH